MEPCTFSPRPSRTRWCCTRRVRCFDWRPVVTLLLRPLTGVYSPARDSIMRYELSAEREFRGGEICDRLYIAGLSAVLLVAPASAQLIVSTIRGSVTDPTGTPVSGAELKVVNLGTNIQRTVGSNDAGEHEVSDLASGSYRLTATHAGFKTFIADNVILENTQIR